MVSFDSRAARFLAIALFVSLGVNFFLGGLVLGRAASPPAEIVAVPPPTPQPPGGPAPGALPSGGVLQQMMAAIPQEYRPAMRQAFELRRREIAAATLGIREARQRTREALRAETFDRARLDAAFAQLRARNDSLAAVLHGAAIEAATQMPVDVRRDLAEWGTRPRERARPPRPEGR